MRSAGRCVSRRLVAMSVRLHPFPLWFECAATALHCTALDSCACVSLSLSLRRARPAAPPCARPPPSCSRGAATSSQPASQPGGSDAQRRCRQLHTSHMKNAAVRCERHSGAGADRQGERRDDRHCRLRHDSECSEGGPRTLTATGAMEQTGTRSMSRRTLPLLPRRRRCTNYPQRRRPPLPLPLPLRRRWHVACACAACSVPSCAAW